MSDSINILPSQMIDLKKWDRCINENDNGLIYTTTAYLNHLAPNWHAIVIGDYNAVMPLPWKRKAGIRYYYVPPFIQQLGITGVVDGEMINNIIASINAFCPYGDIHFNFSNTTASEKLAAHDRTNFLVPLVAGYENIQRNYKHNAVENIRKAENEKLQYGDGSTDDAIALYKTLYSSRTPQVKQKDYARFAALCKDLQASGHCLTRTIIDEDNKILCSAILLKDEKRIYNIANAVTQNGREKEANYFLFDQLLREFAGSKLYFDMEGSDLPGVKQFYEKFGPVNQPYYHYHHNRLPAIIRYFKQ